MANDLIKEKNYLVIMDGKCERCSLHEAQESLSSSNCVVVINTGIEKAEKECEVQELEWSETSDANGNTKFFAPSLHTDEYGSILFYWRIGQMLVDDKIVWTDLSDHHLLPDKDLLFDTAIEAKAHMNRKSMDLVFK